MNIKHHHSHPAADFLALAVALCALLSFGCHGNQYDPHLYPAAGPFCEGWYMRLVDPAHHVSIGFLFGRVLPAEASNHSSNCQGKFACAERGGGEGGRGGGEITPPLVVAGVLIQDNSSLSLRSVQTAFPLHDYSVTVRGGAPVTHNPDDKSPPNFTVQFGGNGSVQVRDDGTTIVDVRVGELSLSLRAGLPVPWGPGGEGPEGWLEHLPLPIHWFVYSLRSTVFAYKVKDLVTGGAVVSGSRAWMHMEKNWGESFPPAWVWSQGVTDTNITWAVSGGIVDFKVINVTAFLAGYRNPAKNLSINFTPANSVAMTFTPRGCQGAMTLTLTSLTYRLEMKVTSSPSSFSRCLLGPEKNGFRPACVESYDAVAFISVYHRHPLRFVLVDEVVIRQAALEFGGLYVCKQKCSVGG